MNAKVIVATVGCALCIGLNAEMPVIPHQNVVFNQNSNSRLVTISYELQEAPAIVTVDILTNGVSIGEQNFTTIYGDVNKLGTSKIFVETGSITLSLSYCRSNPHEVWAQVQFSTEEQDDRTEVLEIPISPCRRL